MCCSIITVLDAEFCNFFSNCSYLQVCMYTLLVVHTTEHLVVIWATNCRRLYTECSNYGSACRQPTIPITVVLCRWCSVTLRKIRRWQLLTLRKCCLALAFQHPHCETDADSEWSVGERHFFATTNETTSIVKPTRCNNVSNLFYFGIILHVSDSLSVHHQ